MVLAARRSYSDLTGWMKQARPRSLRPWRLALKVFRSLTLGALTLLGVIGLASPARFGAATSRAGASTGWWALMVLVAFCLIWMGIKSGGIRTTVARIAEPLSRPLDHVSSFEPAWGALESCPAPLRTRFALGWVWGPVAVVVLAAVFAASVAYFVVDMLLAEFTIGPEQPLLLLINGALALIVLRLGAKRLSTWRLAFSVHRAASGHYV